jgi:hypothetical protein
MTHYYMVHYRISDPAKFWAGVNGQLATVPKDVKIHFSAPNQNGSELTSLWEGADPGVLQQFLKTTTMGGAANFEAMKVDIGKAFGLPI